MLCFDPQDPAIDLNLVAVETICFEVKLELIQASLVNADGDSTSVAI